jgi:hypothetical protein
MRTKRRRFIALRRISPQDMLTADAGGFAFFLLYHTHGDFDEPQPKGIGNTTGQYCNERNNLSTQNIPARKQDAYKGAI